MNKSVYKLKNHHLSTYNSLSGGEKAKIIYCVVIHLKKKQIYLFWASLGLH